MVCSADYFIICIPQEVAETPKEEVRSLEPAVKEKAINKKAEAAPDKAGLKRQYHDWVDRF
jgi:hypothetical protein